MAMEEHFKQFVSKRCEEILFEFKADMRNEICRKYQNMKKELSVEVIDVFDDYIEQVNALESEKEDYLYMRAFIDGLTMRGK